MLNLFDSHTHSDNSPDGNHSVTFICEKAADNGLMGIAITDHCEISTYESDSYQLRMLQSVFEARKAQLFFAGRLTITAGIELGQPLFDTTLARRATELQNYDIVLGSVHIVRGGEDYYLVDYSQLSKGECRELLDKYFNEVYETVKWGGFDVLAHLTYPLRYLTGSLGIEYDLAPHEEALRAILKALAKGGKGLEINTSGLYGSYGRTMPERDVIKLFSELGGEIVTLGSDAHRAEHVGGGIERGMELLKSCGFSRFAFYKKRAPRMLDIL